MQKKKEKREGKKKTVARHLACNKVGNDIFFERRDVVRPQPLAAKPLLFMKNREKEKSLPFGSPRT